MTSILILCKKEFKETFHKLITCLAVVDIIFILCSIFVSVTKAWGLLTEPDQTFLESFLLVVYPVGSFALITSMYLTVSISVERYCGICYPFHSRKRIFSLYLCTL